MHGPGHLEPTHALHLQAHNDGMNPTWLELAQAHSQGCLPGA